MLKIFSFFCNKIHLTPSNRCTKKEVSSPGLREIISILLSAGLFLCDDPGAESAAGGRDHAEHVLPGYDLQKDLCAKVRRTHLALQHCQAPGSRRIQEDLENRLEHQRQHLSSLPGGGYSAWDPVHCHWSHKREKIRQKRPGNFHISGAIFICLYLCLNNMAKIYLVFK